MLIGWGFNLINDKEMKAYLKGGKCIKKPVDVNGVEIKEGSVLTTDNFDNYFNDDYYKKYHPDWSMDEIINHNHKATYKVMWNEKGFFYGIGINQELYLHDFRFKYTKVLL